MMRSYVKTFVQAPKKLEVWLIGQDQLSIKNWVAFSEAVYTLDIFRLVRFWPNGT